jgi:hypothetical protein
MSAAQQQQQQQEQQEQSVAAQSPAYEQPPSFHQLPEAAALSTARGRQHSQRAASYSGAIAEAEPDLERSSFAFSTGRDASTPPQPPSALPAELHMQEEFLEYEDEQMMQEAPNAAPPYLQQRPMSAPQPSYAPSEVSTGYYQQRGRQQARRRPESLQYIPTRR